MGFWCLLGFEKKKKYNNATGRLILSTFSGIHITCILYTDIFVWENVNWSLGLLRTGKGLNRGVTCT